MIFFWKNVPIKIAVQIITITSWFNIAYRFYRRLCIAFWPSWYGHFLDLRIYSSLLLLVDVKKINWLQKNFDNVPFYKINEREYKIPAAWLIEKCGFKGIKEGNTGTHNKHALIIINLGNATGKEIFDFSQKIKKAVLRKFNILLEEKVNII